MTGGESKTPELWWWGYLAAWQLTTQLHKDGEWWVPMDKKNQHNLIRFTKPRPCNVTQLLYIEPFVKCNIHTLSKQCSNLTSDWLAYILLSCLITSVVEPELAFYGRSRSWYFKEAPALALAPPWQTKIIKYFKLSKTPKNLLLQFYYFLLRGWTNLPVLGLV